MWVYFFCEKISGKLGVGSGEVHAIFGSFPLPTPHFQLL